MGSRTQGARPPAGNHYGKYTTRNPLARRLVQGFLRAHGELLAEIAPPRRTLDVGCGEGFLLARIREAHPASDLVGVELDEPTARQAASHCPSARIVVADAENLPLRPGTFDLIVCCEVLEHLPHPRKALRGIRALLSDGGTLLASVPWEPVWRMLNLARGAYVSRLGNTPGHLQHFGRRHFLEVLSSEGFRVQAVRTPLPWTFARATGI